MVFAFGFFLLLQILLNIIIKRFAILFCLLNENRDTKRKKMRNELTISFFSGTGDFIKIVKRYEYLSHDENDDADERKMLRCVLVNIKPQTIRCLLAKQASTVI